MEISRLTRDGTAEPVSRDQILRCELDRETYIFPVQLTTSRIANLTRLILTPIELCDDHTYIIHTFSVVVVSNYYSFVPLLVHYYSLFISRHH